MSKQNGELFSLPKGVVRIESFTQKGKFYEIDSVKRICSCPAFQRNKRRCKHLDSLFKVNIKKVEGFSVSLLKSNLQKAVRRNNVDIALKTAKELINIDEIQFLRRWLIIILEDVLLYHKYSEIVEILKRLSSDKYEKLTDEEKDFLIDGVVRVAASEFRENWIDWMFGVVNNPEEKEAEEFMSGNYSKVFKLPEKERELVLAIQYRSSIGGMNGDIVMLKNQFNVWSKRFIKEEWTYDKLKGYFEKVEEVKFSEIPKLKKEEILLEAVDFHCSSILNILLKKEWVNVLSKREYSTKKPEDVIMGVMWKMRSGICFKKEIGSLKERDWYGKNDKFFVNDNREKDLRIFEKIKEEINNIAKWYLSKT